MYGQVRGLSPVFRMGRVIDVKDEYRAGRARVRLFGEMDDESAIPDDMVPWATPMMPVTSPSIGGAGQSSGLEKGSRVLCMVLDYPDNQNIIIMGSHFPVTDENGSTKGNQYPPRAVADRGPDAPQGQSKPEGGILGNVGVDDQVRERMQRMLQDYAKA